MNLTGKTKHELKKTFTTAQYSGDKTSILFSTKEMYFKNRKCRLNIMTYKNQCGNVNDIKTNY